MEQQSRQLAATRTHHLLLKVAKFTPSSGELRLAAITLYVSAAGLLVTDWLRILSGAKSSKAVAVVY